MKQFFGQDWRARVKAPALSSELRTFDFSSSSNEQELNASDERGITAVREKVTSPSTHKGFTKLRFYAALVSCLRKRKRPDCEVKTFAQLALGSLSKKSLQKKLTVALMVSCAGGESHSDTKARFRAPPSNLRSWRLSGLPFLVKTRLSSWTKLTP